MYTIMKNPFCEIVAEEPKKTLGLDIEREGRFEKDYIFKEVIGESENAIVSRCRNKLDWLDYSVKVQKQGDAHSPEGMLECYN